MSFFLLIRLDYVLSLADPTDKADDCVYLCEELMELIIDKGAKKAAKVADEAM